MTKESENPISEFIGQSIETGISLVIILPILIVTFTILIAPMFGYYLKGDRIATYGSEQDPRCKHDMLVIWIFLWGVCILGWALVIWANQPSDKCGFQ
jgi:hypothetical protein